MGATRRLRIPLNCCLVFPGEALQAPVHIADATRHECQKRLGFRGRICDARKQSILRGAQIADLPRQLADPGPLSRLKIAKKIDEAAHFAR